MKKRFIKCSSLLASFALLFATYVENSVCFLYAYQPETPEEIKKLSKIKNNDVD